MNLLPKLFLFSMVTILTSCGAKEDLYPARDLLDTPWILDVASHIVYDSAHNVIFRKETLNPDRKKRLHFYSRDGKFEHRVMTNSGFQLLDNGLFKHQENEVTLVFMDTVDLKPGKYSVDTLTAHRLSLTDTVFKSNYTDGTRKGHYEVVIIKAYF
jgi:hypothetical protein